MFTGCGTALVTPFRRDGSLDEATLRALVRRQVAAGIDFVCPCGTTGESPTLTRQEHLRVVELTLEEGKGKVPVVAGAGGYNTADVISLVRELTAMGVDGIVSVSPYYNKPTQEGLYQHYKAIAAATTLPVLLYSVQSRTGVNIEPGTVKRLSEIANIVGIKEASGSITQMGQILNMVHEDFVVLSGDDSMALPLMALGGRGFISVISNQTPAEMIGQVGAARTTLLPSRTKHKVIHDQLASAAKQVSQRHFAVRAIEYILLFSLLPRQFAPLLAQLIS